MIVSSNFPKELFNELIGIEAYLVGGAIRDFLYFQLQSPIEEVHDKNIVDFDFVIFDFADLASFAKKLADKTNSHFVELDDQNKIYRLINQNWQADFAAPRGSDINEDLKARDFTINSMALKLPLIDDLPKQNSLKDLIDPLNGYKDLQAGLIRANNEANLKDDPLRILRAYRIAAGLNSRLISQSDYKHNSHPNFQIESQTREIIRELANSKIFAGTAGERISFELWLLLSQSKSFEYLKQLSEDGVLEIIFPEFAALKKVPPNDFHHLPLLEHTLELVRQYEGYAIQEVPDSCLQFIKENNLSNISMEAIIKMSCLLHDIGKPATWEIKENNKHTFYGHDALGGEMTEKIGKRMLWPRAVINLLVKLVDFHLRPFCIAPIDSEPTEKAERRFFRQLGDDFHPLIALAWADMLSIRGPRVDEQMIALNKKRLTDLSMHYETYSAREKREPFLLAGDLLIQAIQKANLQPTKLIKELLNEIRDIQMAGQISSEEEAFNWFVNEANKGTLGN